MLWLAETLLLLVWYKHKKKSKVPFGDARVKFIVTAPISKQQFPTRFTFSSTKPPRVFPKRAVVKQ